MATIAFALGTRPEAIKLAPVIHRVRNTRGMRAFVLVTAQHRDMLDQVLDVMDIQPDIDLNLMKPGQTLESFTAAAIPAVSEALKLEQPAIVLVQGDTTTAFAAALAAFYQKIEIGHVEAGLRSGDRMSPFPEEVNRVLADHMSALHFAPTEAARQNLLAEGIQSSSIHVTGNTGIDALLTMSRRGDLETLVQPRTLIPMQRPFILATAHRRENHGQRLEGICSALLRLAADFPEHPVVFPAHPNPQVQQTVNQRLRGVRGIHVLPPLDYPTMVWLMRESRLILTDSGGIQEEAPYLGKPVLVLRDTTERPEGVAAGVAKLIGTDSSAIFSAAAKLLSSDAAYRDMCGHSQPYGDGNAAGRIVAAVRTHLQGANGSPRASRDMAVPFAGLPAQAGARR